MIWLFIFFGAWLVWTTIKVFDLEMDKLELITLICLLFSVSVQAYYAFKDRYLRSKMRQDPQLKEILNDELEEYNRLRAWRTAFISLVVYIILLGILSFWVHFGDLFLLIITGLLIGFGTYNTSVFIRNR